MIRLGADEPFLTCDDCGHAYPADEVTEAEDDRALAAVVAAVIFSDSAVRSTEKEVAREVIRRYTGRDLSPAGADELLRRSRKQWGDPGARLARLRHIVPESVRRRIVEAAYHVCTADRELHPQESRFLEHVGEMLDLTPRQVRAAIETAKRNPVRAD